MSEELKPCPFCGSVPIGPHQEHGGDFWVECRSCEFTFYYGNGVEEVVRRWNARAREDAPLLTNEAIARLQEQCKYFEARVNELETSTATRRTSRAGLGTT